MSDPATWKDSDGAKAYQRLVPVTNELYAPTDTMAETDIIIELEDSVGIKATNQRHEDGNDIKMSASTSNDDDDNDFEIHGENDVTYDDEVEGYGENDPLLQVNIERPAYSSSGLHRRYGYQPEAQPSPVEVVRKKATQCRCSLSSVKRFILYLFPALEWLPKYDLRNNAVGDLMAGLTVGTVNIPQSMAFSLLANLPPVYGLYTAFFAPFAFFLMGSSRHTSVGTFGVISILAGDAVESILSRKYPGTISPSTSTHAHWTNTPEVTSPNNVTFDTPTTQPCGEICDERIKIHVTLCLMVGMIQILMAICRLGIVTVYLAHPLARAFTTGAACHVFTSLVPPLLGLSLQRYEGPLSLIYTWRDVFINLPKTNVATLLIGVVAFIILAPGKYISARYKDRIKIPIPWELLVVIVTIMISYFVNVQEKYGVDIINDIPLGFPPPVLPSFVYFGDLIGDAIAIAIVGFAVSVSVAKIFATKNDYEIESNQELMGYGAANLTSSFFSCFVSSSALGRVAILDGSGGKTQVAMIISSLLVMFTILLLGPLFEPLPKSVLSVIIMFALRGILAQFTDLRQLFNVSKIDCLIWIVTWLSVVLLGVDLGLGVGVVFALLTVIVRTQLPRFYTKARLAETEFYRDVNEYETAKPNPEIHIFQMQATLYYANAEQFKRALLRETGVNPIQRLTEISNTKKMTSDDNNLGLEGSMCSSELVLKTIIIDCGHFDFVDTSGVRTLDLLNRDFGRIGIKIIYASCPDSVMRTIQVMSPSHGDEEAGPRFFPSLHDAVSHVTRTRETDVNDMQPPVSTTRTPECVQNGPEIQELSV